jgi:hypothetical protein
MKSNAYAMQPLAVAMAITQGTEGAAILFFDLWYFISNLEAKQELILTDERLGERTGLTYTKVRRAKRFLVNHGLIKTRRKRDQKYHNGNTVSHISIPNAVLALAEQLRNGTAQICTVGNEQNHIGQTVQGCTLPIYIEKIEKKKATSSKKGSGKKIDSSNNEEKLLAQLKKGFGYGGNSQ